MIPLHISGKGRVLVQAVESISVGLMLVISGYRIGLVPVNGVRGMLVPSVATFFGGMVPLQDFGTFVTLVLTRM